MISVRMLYLAVMILVFSAPGCAANHQESYCQKLDRSVHQFVRLYDKNGDSKLDRKEWSSYESVVFAGAKAFDKQTGSHTPPAEITRLFDKYDKDHDGYVTAKEMKNGLCPDSPSQ